MKITFKPVLAAFIASELIIIFLNLHYGSSLRWLWFPLSLLLLTLIYGSARIQSGFFAPVLCGGKGPEKQIALTFDDGPSAFTEPVLDVLAEHHAPAAFFVIGKNIAGNEAAIKRMARESHIIGNHSYSHSVFIDLKLEQGFRCEISQAEETVFALTSKRMALFRPPFGVMTPHLVKAAKRLKYVLIGWTVRSLDTTLDSPESIVQRIRSQVEPGGVILMHDTSEKSVEALKQILDFTRHNGYKIVGIDRLLNVVPYKPDDNK